MMMRAVALWLLIAPSLVAAQSASRQAVIARGFSPDRLARVDTFLQQYVDSNRIAGAVALVIRDGQVVYERAVGWADREAGRRMAPSAMFRIASQTKALTSIAAMVLVEEGKLALDTPVSRFIPSFARTTVASRGEAEPQTKPANRPITVRDLLTHTSGYSYGTDSMVADSYRSKGLGPVAGRGGWYTADKEEPICTTMETLGTLPAVRQPGTAWVYGYNTDILGCVVERASGMSLDQFIRTRITEPLGMRDTYFYVPAATRERLVAVYESDEANHARRAPDGARGQGHYVDGPRRSFSGGAGVVSTARDYGRLLQMMLNGGELNGARVLSPKAVAVMTTNQIDTLYPQKGMGFGLGFAIVEHPGADNTLSSEGTFGWGGAYGSNYRVDPKERLVLVFMLNQLPNRADVGSLFPNLVYQALVK
jgi:CubicO group peptidase (beta-lactamase class C family)